MSGHHYVWRVYDETAGRTLATAGGPVAAAVRRDTLAARYPSRTLTVLPPDEWATKGPAGARQAVARR